MRNNAPVASTVPIFKRTHYPPGRVAGRRVGGYFPVALRAAVVDPDHNVLLDDNPTNNHASVESNRRAPRVAERLAYWAELWMQALGP